jgi:hypothetical protein
MVTTISYSNCNEGITASGAKKRLLKEAAPKKAAVKQVLKKLRL